MNFKKDVTEIMSSLNWATAEEEYTPSEHWYNGTEVELVDAEGHSVVPPVEPSSGKANSEAQKARLNKRKTVTNALHSTREELFAGEFDG